MPVTEYARMLHAVNTILEKASSSVNLSKRAALALAIMNLRGDGQIMTSTILQEEFVKHSISTMASAPKDASTAKSELLEKGCIAIRIKVSEFVVSDEGQRLYTLMYRAMELAIEDLGLTASQRRILRLLGGLPPRPRGRPAASETGGPSSPKTNVS
jgi:hypothetical protein